MKTSGSIPEKQNNRTHLKCPNSTNTIYSLFNHLCSIYAANQTHATGGNKRCLTLGIVRVKILMRINRPEHPCWIANQRQTGHILHRLLNPLRLNVGFMIKQSIGFVREFVFDYADVRLEDDLDLDFLKGSALVSRTPQGLVVQATIQTALQTVCVRCLSPCSHPIETEFTELFAFSERTATESGLILPRDGHIDLNPIAREYLLLEIPIKPLCKPDCKGLCPECGENLNEHFCGHTNIPVDPRLEILKNLLNKN